MKNRITAQVLLTKCILLLLLPSSAYPFAELGAKAAPTLSAVQSPSGTPAQKPDTTTETSQLSLNRNIMFVRLQNGFFEVREIFMFENKGKKTIVSKDGAPTLKFTLPGSSNIRDPAAVLSAPIQGLNSNNVRQSGTEIFSTEPIALGTKFVVLFYRLADEYGGITVQRPVTYGTTSFAILPEKGRVQLEATGLKLDTPIKFQGGEYESYVSAIPVGSVLRFSLKAPDSAGGLVYFYMALGAIFVLGTGGAVLIRRRRRSGLALQVEREEIIRSISELDDRLAMGTISTEEHENKRIPCLNHLRELSR